MSRKKGKSNAEYKKVLEKLQSIDSSGPFWGPKPGKHVIRILPEVGDMEMFFKEVGIHRVDNTNHFCPDVCTDGDEPCPACEVNQALYQAGEVEAASRFRYQRKFYMNVIVRGEESNGPRIYTPGITVMTGISSLIQDPDYGPIYDEEEGTDVVIVRTGTGLDTNYQVRAAKDYGTPLSDDEEEIEEWLSNAVDLEKYVAGKLVSYEKLAKLTGAAPYLDIELDEEEDDEEDESDEEVPLEEEEDEETSASAIIAKRLARRKGAASTRRSRRRG